MYYLPDVVYNWNKLVLRVVRANDYEDMENIIAIDKDHLFLMTWGQMPLKYQSHLYRDLVEVCLL